MAQVPYVCQRALLFASDEGFSRDGGVMGGGWSEGAATQYLDNPEHDKYRQNQTKNTAQSDTTICAVAEIPTTAADKQEHQNDEYDCIH
tara:strand:+ start:803 stop:1069 length:267 start_codon:yes stop_codon:yes gene_type:complete